MSEGDYNNNVDVDDFLRGLHSEPEPEEEKSRGQSTTHEPEHNETTNQPNKDTSTKNERKRQIFEILPEEVKAKLRGNIWTRISDHPTRFLVAREKECEICRAAILTKIISKWDPKKIDDIGEKVVYLEFGTTVFKIFPVKVILHENPLEFLDSPTLYTITFENQSYKRFSLTGNIDYIMQRLKEMPGCVISSRGTTEALTSIIGAMEEDGKLVIERSVPFEGYYYDKRINDIVISKIDFSQKHPIRSPFEILDCIDYLEKRAAFQLWRYNGKQVDRRDVLASAIQWTVSAPYNFCIKQINKGWQRWFDTGGDRDTGKSSLTKECLRMHDHDGLAGSIYSFSIGSADTEAKFAKAISQTTYPVEISEIKTIEGYGRSENLVSIFLTSAEGLVSRRGRGEGSNNYHTPFPSCSSVILNGNPMITRKGEVAKRLHIVRNSEEDRHSRDPNSPFNKFQSEHSWKLKVLGDWTMRYIYENRQDLLLSGKYDTEYRKSRLKLSIKVLARLCLIG